MPQEFTRDERVKIVSWREIGMTYQNIAERLGNNRTKAGVRLCYQRYLLRGNVNDAPRAGRPKHRNQPEIVRTVVTAMIPQALHVKPLSPRLIQRRYEISRSTVQRIMKDQSIKTYKTLKVQQLTDINKQRRLQLCRNLLTKVS